MKTIPRYAQAVFAALHFAPDFHLLSRLTAPEWHDLVHFCRRTQLAIPFALACGDHRFHRDLVNNAERWERVKQAYRQASEAFESAGLEFVTLKGFTHAPGFVADPRLRTQYDLDLLFPPEQAWAARDIALKLGYEPFKGGNGAPVDHLPTLIRKTGWEWRGDYFDPELPLALELHFRLWDTGTEGFALAGVVDFWHRRERRTLEDVEFTSLAAIDLPGYAAAHTLRHLLRGDARPWHIYEIACFLERNHDTDFWSNWRDAHDKPLRRVQAICFAMARQWFGCRLPAVAQEEAERLPQAVRAWLALYAHSPIINLLHSTKDELWLHLSLLDPGASRLRVLRRRLMPLQLPGPVDAVHLPDEAIGWRVRLRACLRYFLFLASRMWRHTAALLPTMWSGARWARALMNLAHQIEPEEHAARRVGRWLTQVFSARPGALGDRDPGAGGESERESVAE